MARSVPTFRCPCCGEIKPVKGRQIYEMNEIYPVTFHVCPNCAEQFEESNWGSIDEFSEEQKCGFPVLLYIRFKRLEYSENWELIPKVNYVRTLFDVLDMVEEASLNIATNNDIELDYDDIEALVVSGSKVRGMEYPPGFEKKIIHTCVETPNFWMIAVFLDDDTIYDLHKYAQLPLPLETVFAVPFYLAPDNGEAFYPQEVPTDLSSIDSLKKAGRVYAKFFRDIFIPESLAENETPDSDCGDCDSCENTSDCPIKELIESTLNLSTKGLIESTLNSSTKGHELIAKLMEQIYIMRAPEMKIILVPNDNKTAVALVGNENGLSGDHIDFLVKLDLTMAGDGGVVYLERTQHLPTTKEHDRKVLFITGWMIGVDKITPIKGTELRGIYAADFPKKVVPMSKMSAIKKVFLDADPVE